MCACCIISAGHCHRCRNSAYLLHGRCVQKAAECVAAGQIAVGGPGDSAYGRACVEPGGLCSLDSTHSCRSPKNLGECSVSRVTRENTTCIKCHADSWLVKGEISWVQMPCAFWIWCGFLFSCAVMIMAGALLMCPWLTSIKHIPLNSCLLCVCARVRVLVQSRRVQKAAFLWQRKRV